MPWCQYQLSFPLFHPEFSSLTFLEFSVLTGFFLLYYCCPLQGPWRTNSWFIKHCVWRKASISVHKIVRTVGCVLLFFTNYQDSECLFYSFTFFKCSMFFWSSLWGIVNEHLNKKLRAWRFLWLGIGVTWAWMRMHGPFSWNKKWLESLK